MIKLYELLDKLEPKKHGWYADTIVYDEFVGIEINKEVDNG